MHMLLGTRRGAIASPPDTITITANIDHMITMLSQQEFGVDVIELCGGEGGIGRIAARRHLQSGGNYDLITKDDLNEEYDQ